MSDQSGKSGGVGRFILKAVPYVASYLLGRRSGRTGTRKDAKREISEQRELGEHEAQGVRDELEKKPTGDYIRREKI